MPITSVVLAISSKANSDCKKLILSDNTGAYNVSSNPLGFGDTGVPANQLDIQSVSTATVDIVIYTTDGAVETIPQIQVFPTIYNPDFVACMEYTITNVMMGYDTSEKLPDGIYHITYTVNGVVNSTLVSYTAAIWAFRSCQADCCLGIKLGELDPNCDECKDENEDFCNAKMNLMAGESAIQCNKPKKALQFLKSVQDYCENSECTSC